MHVSGDLGVSHEMRSKFDGLRDRILGSIKALPERNLDEFTTAESQRPTATYPDTPAD